MSAGPIPFSAIDRYGARHGIAGDDFDFFAKMIRAMDRVVLDQARSDTPAWAKPAASGRPMSPELFDALF